MADSITGRRKPTKPKKQARAQKRKREDEDVERLQRAVTELDVRAVVSKFADLPLSEATKAGLKACHFSTLTEIQARGIPLALKGSDILGAAKTGSGKTLAFVVPVLENLYRAQCVGVDAGLGAMIISPTRELAIQIFEVLRKIGKHGHLFAAGLIIGGRSLQEEQNALARMNIVVCTPGRILQHLSQTATFNIDNLKMLVLDEADRIMDMGFQPDVDAVIEYLPRQRQTLLFSATQTRKVSDLARLSLRNPDYVSVHESAVSATPQKLQQTYVLTPLPTKLDVLWSFIQSSKKTKMIVFFSSGKQVRFVYEAFRQMQPGIPLLHLHGRQKQTTRLEIVTRFSASRHSCLFATDVAARGLDFPAVDWVVQVDCPEDAETYIHRVGRTARYERAGKAVLFLDPFEEEGMLQRMAHKKVPIERISVRARKQTSITNQLQSLCFKDPELKYLGQKAFISYVRSLHLQKDKEIFKVEKYLLEAFAASLGLPGAPKIKFGKGERDASKQMKNAPRQILQDGKSCEAPLRTKYDRMFERRNQDILAPHYTAMIDGVDDASSTNGEVIGDTDASGGGDDHLLTVKQRFAQSPPPTTTVNDGTYPRSPIGRGASIHLPLKPESKRQLKALTSKKKMAKLMNLTSTKLVFDDVTGEARPALPFGDESVVGRDAGEKEDARKRFVEAEADRMRERDLGDRETAREKKRLKRDKARHREGFTVGQDEAEDDSGEETSRVSKPFEELADLFPDGVVEDGAELRPSPGKENQRGESGYSNDVEDDAESHEEKRRKTTFKTGEAVPETLEALEMLVTGLLD